ncbi:MAG: hypothetical protein HY735_23030 [Verrucomicrobia bacterium]|nr:hypothetical protein [Verrucomicrobiota bacterium]
MRPESDLYRANSTGHREARSVWSIQIRFTGAFSGQGQLAGESKAALKRTHSKRWRDDLAAAQDCARAFGVRPVDRRFFGPRPARGGIQSGAQAYSLQALAHRG